MGDIRAFWAVAWLLVTAAAIVAALLVLRPMMRSGARFAAFLLVSLGFFVAVRDSVGHQDIMGRGISATGYGTVVAALGCLVTGFGLQLLRPHPPGT